MKTPKFVVFLKSDSSAFLCRDGKFRRLPWYGTYPETLKTYGSLGWALNCQKRLDKNGVKATVHVISNGKFAYTCDKGIVRQEP